MNRGGWGYVPTIPPCSSTIFPRSRKISLSSCIPPSISLISDSLSAINDSWKASCSGGILAVCRNRVSRSTKRSLCSQSRERTGSVAAGLVAAPSLPAHHCHPQDRPHTRPGIHLPCFPVSFVPSVPTSFAFLRISFGFVGKPSVQR
jgi:hypothetical protein